MAAIEREQENTIDKINWFTTLNNVPTDFYSVDYQIWDISGGLPGDVIFPVPGDPGSWESVGSGPGHFSVGSYYAYDNTLGQGWTPGAAEPLGTHRIKWRWKVTSGDAYRSGMEDFEVLSVGAGPGPDTYIEVQDVRDEGLLVADYPDAKVLSYIEIFQAFIDRACRQWFLPREMILEVDGNDSDTLFFGVPIISIEYIKLNGSADELDSSLYKVYSDKGMPDDRRNPRIALVGPGHYRDIYVMPLTYGQLKFFRGYKNQEIKGVFGFVEEDSLPPKLIKRALLKLVIEKLTSPLYSSTGLSPSPPPILGPVLEEKTDGHSMKYANPASMDSRKFGLSGITSDPEILDIIKLYKGPIGIASPAQWSYY